LSDARLFNYTNSCVKAIRTLLTAYQLLESMKTLTADQTALVDGVLGTRSARLGYSKFQ
jgi:hypothetical protein